MWEVGVRKVTKIMMFFLWVQVMEWSLVGYYVGKNGDLEVSFHLGTNYTIQEGYYNWKKMCVCKKWYLEAKLGRTWAYFPIFPLSQHSFSTSHYLQYLLSWVVISQILQPWLLSKTQHWYAVVRASQGSWIPKPLSSEDIYSLLICGLKEGN